MQAFTDSPGFANLSRPQRLFVVGLTLIGVAIVWFGHATFGDRAPNFGLNLVLFSGIYALVHELDATKRQLKHITQVTNTENVNIACQTVNVIEGDKQ